MNLQNIIYNTPVNPLTIPNWNINTKIMAKLNKSKPVILVDTSYWLYYRFFALRKWYNTAYPDVCVGSNFNMEHNWFEDVVFMTKFRKLFIENLVVLCRKIQTDISNVVFCIDCSYKDIWRNEILCNNEYKATRSEALKKKQFNSFDIFSYMKRDYLSELAVQYGIKILYHSKCEADDIIGQFAPFLITNNIPMVYIVANDNDYLQICESRIKMISGNLKDLFTNENNKKKIQSNRETGIRYLIRKILLGDVSDNIRGCFINGGILKEKIITHTNSNTSSGSGSGSGSSGSSDSVVKWIDPPEWKNNMCVRVTKSNIDRLMDNPVSYEYFYNCLIATRNNEMPDTTHLSIGCDDRQGNFCENTILMDFQLIPKDIKKELEHKFNNLLF
jgi:5'-3' exonuclease